MVNILVNDEGKAYIVNGEAISYDPFYSNVIIYNNTLSQYINSDASLINTIENRNSISLILNGQIKNYFDWNTEHNISNSNEKIPIKGGEVSETNPYFDYLNNINYLFFQKLCELNKIMDSTSLYIRFLDNLENDSYYLHYSISFDDETIITRTYDDKYEPNYYISFNNISNSNIHKLVISNMTNINKTLYKYKTYNLTSTDLNSTSSWHPLATECFTHIGYKIDNSLTIYTEEEILNLNLSDSHTISWEYTYPETFTLESTITVGSFNYSSTVKAYGYNYGATEAYSCGSSTLEELKSCYKRYASSSYYIVMEWSKNKGQGILYDYSQPSSLVYKYCDIYINNVLKYTKTLTKVEMIGDDIGSFRSTATDKMALYNAIPTSGSFNIKWVFRQS